MELVPQTVICTPNFTSQLQFSHALLPHTVCKVTNNNNNNNNTILEVSHMQYYIYGRLFQLLYSIVQLHLVQGHQTLLLPSPPLSPRPTNRRRKGLGHVRLVVSISLHIIYRVY